MEIKHHGFSLIELIVVIAITAVLLAVALPNLLSGRERARDAKRKQEVRELKNALRMYYNDFQTYPEGASGGIGKLNYIKGCGEDANTLCPCVFESTSVDFAVGASCETVYMKRFPSELGSNALNYHQAVGGDDFCLDVLLENAGDAATYTNVVASGKTVCSACASYCSGNKYCVCAD